MVTQKQVLIDESLSEIGADTESLELLSLAAQGQVSRTLLKPTEGPSSYAAIAEHKSEETFMAMHLSKDREEAFKRVEALFEGRPTFLSSSNLSQWVKVRKLQSPRNKFLSNAHPREEKLAPDSLYFN